MKPVVVGAEGPSAYALALGYRKTQGGDVALRARGANIAKAIAAANMAVVLGFLSAPQIKLGQEEVKPGVQIPWAEIAEWAAPDRETVGTDQTVLVGSHKPANYVAAIAFRLVGGAVAVRARGHAITTAIYAVDQAARLGLIAFPRIGWVTEEIDPAGHRVAVLELVVRAAAGQGGA